LLLSSLELSDSKVYEPQIRALLGTASHFCEVVVLKSCGAQALVKRLEQYQKNVDAIKVFFFFITRKPRVE